MAKQRGQPLTQEVDDKASQKTSSYGEMIFAFLAEKFARFFRKGSVYEILYDNNNRITKQMGTSPLVESVIMTTAMKRNPRSIIIESQNDISLEKEIREYSDLQRQDHEIRERIYLLSRQILSQGVLEADISLEIELQRERDRLDDLRRVITEQEGLLEAVLKEYQLKGYLMIQEEKVVLENKIKRLVLEIRYNRELEQIVERNIRYLELQKARMAGGFSVRWYNEMSISIENLKKVRREIAKSEEMLQERFQASVEILKGISKLETLEIDRVVNWIVRRYVARKRSVNFRAEAIHRQGLRRMNMRSAPLNRNSQQTGVNTKGDVASIYDSKQKIKANTNS